MGWNIIGNRILSDAELAGSSGDNPFIIVMIFPVIGALIFSIIGVFLPIGAIGGAILGIVGGIILTLCDQDGRAAWVNVIIISIVFSVICSVLYFLYYLINQ